MKSRSVTSTPLKRVATCRDRRAPRRARSRRRGADYRRRTASRARNWRRHRPCASATSFSARRRIFSTSARARSSLSFRPAISAWRFSSSVKGSGSRCRFRRRLRQGGRLAPHSPPRRARVWGVLSALLWSLMLSFPLFCTNVKGFDISAAAASKSSRGSGSRLAPPASRGRAEDVQKLALDRRLSLWRERFSRRSDLSRRKRPPPVRRRSRYGPRRY